MATHDYVLDNASGAAFRTDLNNALAAIVSNNSNSSSPATTYAYQWWADTSNAVLKIRNSANNAWIELFQLDGTLTLEDGSASTPALAFRDDLNTGIFSSGADNFDIATGGSVRVNVSSTGINVTGTVIDDGATHDGDVTFTGASANIVFDKSDNAFEFADNAKARFGAGNDMEIYHGSDSNIIDSGGKNFFILHGSDSGIVSLANGAVELYFDHSKKFETNTSGVKVSAGNLFLDRDDAKIICGAGDDLEIFHDGNDSFIKDVGTGGLVLCTQQFLVRNAAADEIQIQASENGSVELYHDNSEKLRTVTNGIHVTGHVRPPSTRDNTDDIGGAGQRWDDIFATNSTIQTSDEKEKENISDTDLGLDFINKLSPKSFKFKGKTRTHYGLIAQDIETVITNLGKTTAQFAPLIKNTLEDGTESYGLRYTELLSPLIKAVQELSAKVVALESA